MPAHAQKILAINGIMQPIFSNLALYLHYLFLKFFVLNIKFFEAKFGRIWQKRP